MDVNSRTTDHAVARPHCTVRRGSSDSLSRQIKQRDPAATGQVSSTQMDGQSPVFFPLTEQQIKDQIHAFIDSIDKAAVCDLASTHAEGRACSVIDQKKGSFNVCFFVRFDSNDETLVLRIPIVPMVRDAWGKLLSEVTTMRYIESNTTIRIPRVYAHGKDGTLIPGASTPFMIMEYVPGRQLDTKTWIHTTKAQRRNLYIDLINILTQLRKLEFTTAGSLMPNPSDESNPIVGPFLSITANEFERSSAMPSTSRVLTSTRQFIDYHCNILSKTLHQPVQELDRRQVKMEIYALESLLKEIPKCIDLSEPSPSFILAHPDLRCGNILIDDGFHIVAIIDWEFAGTIPLQLFTPPPWITGHDPATMLFVTGVPRGDILPEFCTLLREMGNSSSACFQLCQDWGLQQDQATLDEGFLSRVSPIMEILRHPSNLIDVYYPSTFRRLFGSITRRDTVVNDFFEKDENYELAQRAELLIQNSARYTEYLTRHGLLVDDPRARLIEEFLEKTKHLVRAE